jgi:TonB family protein
MIKKNKSKYSIAFIVSIGIHLLFSIYFVKNNLTPEMKIKITEGQKSKKIRTFDLTKVKIISHKELLEMKSQIVANEKTGKKERPKDSKFSSETDQSFDRQTIARNIGTFQEAGKGNNKLSDKIAVENNQNIQQPRKTPKQANIATPKEMKLSDLGGISLSTYKKEIESDKADESSNEINTKQVLHSNAMGTLNGKEGLSALASNNDFVEDIPLGDVTNLNTTENKYYGFYHRIRQKLEQYWGSSIHSRATKLYKSGRRIPASENLITAISVTIGKDGSILDIKIEGSSGIRELDQAAIESFNKAGPFPNPPKGLLVDGRATIQWGFVVKS